MNTTITTNIATRLAFATTITALCFGAAACGTEQGGAEPAAPTKQAAPQQESRVSPRIAERQDLAKARAESFPPGYNKALLAER